MEEGGKIEEKSYTSRRTQPTRTDKGHARSFEGGRERSKEERVQKSVGSSEGRRQTNIR